MKIAVLVGDGMGDYPIPELGGKTPLQSASIPNIRRIAAAGTVRLVSTVPQGMTPGSDVANLSIMGFDPHKVYTGRAPIEAAGAGISMKSNEIAFRCNLIHIENDLINDHSSGHITTAEGRQLIEALDRRLGREGLRFITGTGYRHLVIWTDGPNDGLITTPPHDVLGQPAANHQPRGPRSDEVRYLMDESRAILADHPINRARREAGKRDASQIWLWGQGPRCFLPSYAELYGLSGGVISAVDLVRGIGRLAGLKADLIPGATGFINTDYAAKVKAAMDILAERDFVFVHIEAPDECGHMGERDLKVKAIEAFDREVVGPIWNGLQSLDRPYRLIVTTDHRTPLAVRNHTSEPIPIALLDGPVTLNDSEKPFDEFSGGGQSSGMAFEYLQTILKNN